MKTLCGVALAVALAAFPIAQASAQPRWGVPQDGAGYAGTPVDALPTPFSHGGTCVQACEADYAPCDPDYWKIADRRCNYNQRSIIRVDPYAR